MVDHCGFVCSVSGRLMLKLVVVSPDCSDVLIVAGCVVCSPEVVMASFKLAVNGNLILFRIIEI